VTNCGDKAIVDKFSRLKEILARMQSVAVAFSGGVDSTFLLSIAQSVLEDKVLAVTADSEISARHEMEDARKLAAEFGVRHLIIQSDELKSPEFVKNPVDRCYICKKGRFSAIFSLAQEHGLTWVAEGSNIDDRSDYRPGMKAVLELRVRSPLLEAGLSKAEIRRLSQCLGLSTWDKPPYACLATRIPYGTPITAEKLRQVDAAEEFIRSRSITRQVRVRHYGDTARIEVAEEDIANLLESETRRHVVSFIKNLGFRFVTLDLEGYRTGSLNIAHVEEPGMHI